jgi:putative nucleotidyltransferase with HDIG domain
MGGQNSILLICDDEEAAAYLREELLTRGEYLLHCESAAGQGIEAFKHSPFDVVIARCATGGSPARDLINALKKIEPECIIIALLDNVDEKMLAELSKLGVYDFIGKPFNINTIEKLIFLIKRGIELHSLLAAGRKLNQGLKEQNAALEKQNILLARRIEDSTRNLTRLYEDLRSTYMKTIKVLAKAIDARDHYTHSHSENVARYSVAIAQEMGLSLKDIEIIREACELHDLGKIGIGDNILGKPSGLNTKEWEQIKQHPSVGAQILEPLTFLNEVIDLVRQHHERYDGSGYPEGRKSDDILLGARIIHLADAYEAMVTPRSYRRIPLTREQAIAEIKQKSGTQFDPKVVEAFLRVVDRA